MKTKIAMIKKIKMPDTTFQSFFETVLFISFSACLQRSIYASCCSLYLSILSFLDSSIRCCFSSADSCFERIKSIL